MALNQQQETLVLKYFLTGKREESAIYAGYAKSGAGSTAYRILKTPEAQALLAELRLNAAEHVGLTREGLLRELKLIIESDATHYTLDDNGKVTLAEDAPPEATRALSRLRFKKVTKTDKDGNEYETIDNEFGLWNKGGAIRDAMKYLGMLDEKIDHNVNVTWSDLVDSDE